MSMLRLQISQNSARGSNGVILRSVHNMATKETKVSKPVAFCSLIPPYLLQNIADSNILPTETRRKAIETLRKCEKIHKIREYEQISRAKLTASSAATTSLAAAPLGNVRRAIFDCQGKEGLPLDLDNNDVVDPELPEDLKPYLEPWQGSELINDDAGDPPNSTDDQRAVNLYNYFTQVYDFFAAVYGRNSTDDQGRKLAGCIRYDEAADPKPGFFNAIWLLDVAAFGDSDGQNFNNFTDFIDIVAHEVVHGITGYTAGLEYKNQAGALNESLSDVFASMIKQWSKTPKERARRADWLIGRGLFRLPNARALRDMAYPGTAHGYNGITGGDDQPKDMDGYQYEAPTRYNDNGRVHKYSCIPNRAFYLAATMFGGYSWQRAGKIWYDAMTDPELARQAQTTVQAERIEFNKNAFKIFADLTVKHAEQFGSRAVDIVKQAWTVVKVLDGTVDWGVVSRGADSHDVPVRDDAETDGNVKKEPKL